MSNNNYLAPLAAPRPKAKADVPVSPDWYACMSNGLKDLNAQLEVEREFMDLLEKAAPEIRRLMMIELLSAPALPAPTAASSASQH